MDSITSSCTPKYTLSSFSEATMTELNLLADVGDGRIVKMEVDYKEDVDKLIPQVEALANSGKLGEALEKIYVMEKLTRLGADMHSNTKVQECIVKLCYDAKNWDLLNENIVILSKKRSLIKAAVSKMIKQCCTYVDSTPSEEEQLKLIDTLRKVTDGKIYVEVERARLTYKLVQMKEKEGKNEEAAKLLLDLQVETYGSMDRQEKVEMLLEQMRLCLAKQDFVRASIISKKISVRFFDGEANQVQQLKLKYYRQMIELDTHDSNYVQICRHYLAMYNTPLVQSDPAPMKEALMNAVLYALLASHSPDQQDLINRIKNDRNMEGIEQYLSLVNLLCRDELVSWQHDICAKYQQTLRLGTPTCPAPNVFDSETEMGKKHWADLQTRVGEHNMRILAMYYSKMSLQRMAELLEWDMVRTEDFLCKMIVDGIIPGAKIDRPNAIVSFQPRKSPTETLDEWGANLAQLMNLLNRASHVIQKEEMVHRHLHNG